MSSFNTVYNQVVQHEGVYSNDSNDTGGETVYGVSRNNFPKWSGWRIVDAYKKDLGVSSKEFKKALEQDIELHAEVQSWYKENFWDKFDLDQVQDYSLAYEIFDQAVNLGVGRATRHIQQAINALNYQYVFGSDLVVDGLIGPNTRMKLKDVGNNAKYTDVLRKALDGLQVAHYINLGNSTSGKSNYRKYTRGWLLNRVGKYTEEGRVD